MSELTRKPGYRVRFVRWLKSLPEERRKRWLKRNARAEHRLIWRVLPALMILLGIVLLALYVIQKFTEAPK